MNRLFVYGILRGREELIKENIEVKGFRMYSCGPFPKVFHDSERSIKGDIIEVDDKELFSIDNMEHGAGYHDHWITIEGEKVKMYVGNDESTFNEDELVMSGDWNEYNNEPINN